jgi:hypothetical protein
MTTDPARLLCSLMDGKPLIGTRKDLEWDRKY